MKNIIILSILLLLLSGCIITMGPGNGIKERLSDTIRERGLNGNVTSNSTSIIISFEANGTDGEMVETMILLANKSREVDNRDVLIISNRAGKPYLALIANGSGMFLEDIRSPEWRIIDEMSVFDFYGSISIKDDTITFKGDYVGDKEDFFNQLLSSSLIGFEYSPWVTKMVFLVGPLNITVKKSILLSYIKGGINEDDLIKSLDIFRNTRYAKTNMSIDVDVSDGKCNDKDYAYKQYVKYYNEVTTMMNAQNNGEKINQTKLNKSYTKYLYWRNCYMGSK